MGVGGMAEYFGVDGVKVEGGGRLTWTSSVSFPSGLFAEACICVIGIQHLAAPKKGSSTGIAPGAVRGWGVGGRRNRSTPAATPPQERMRVRN
jgi:hypothetical protein